VTFVLLAVLAAIIVACGLTIAELADRLRVLERQAVTDPLTGAFNRRHFETCLRGAIERHTRFGEPASLVVFDVDRFKDVNDTFGHTAGDAVLKTLVAIGRRRARTLDLLFRTGGEEFALILAGARLDAALAVAEELRAIVAASRLIDGHPISISVGVSELHTGESPLDWLLDADRALYRAKTAGRNRVAGATGRIDASLFRRPAQHAPA
jgi:diguanylate cyclase (GGDEF)-like protein